MDKALSKSIKYIIFIAVVSIVALTGCSNNNESANSHHSSTHQNTTSDSISKSNDEPVSDEEVDGHTNGHNDGDGNGEGIGDIGISEGSEAIKPFIPEGFPIPNDRQMIENETGHIFTETTDIVNITYLTKTTMKDIYDQYLDYFKDYSEYEVTALSSPMLITAVAEKRSYYIDITEADDSTQVYMSISIPKG